jgi:hypothetical protein
MKKVYVAGAYSADNVMDVLHNIGFGIEACSDLLGFGFAPFCPWLDYHFALFNRKIPKQSFYDYSLAWLEASDAVWVLPGWENSKGTIAEIAKAESLNIPVFYDFNKLLNWGGK